MAYQLADIFTLLVVPYMLHSDNGGEFFNRPQLKLVHEKSHHSQSLGSIIETANQDSNNMLTT